MTTPAQRQVAVVLAGADDADRLEAAVELAARVGAPVTLAIAAEVAVGVARTRPALAAQLRDAFAAGRLHAMLTTAHGADAALLTADELADELRLDEETLQALFGVTMERRGFVGTAAAAALEQAGIDFVVGDGDEPCRVGERLMALPLLELDLERLTIDEVERELRAIVDAGLTVVGADTLAATLTPPWLGSGVGRQPSVPPLLTALAELTGWCIDAFGVRRVPGVSAAALLDEGWRLERFPTRARLPLVRRRGLCAGRRAWIAAFELCDVLAVEARVPGLSAHATTTLSATVWPTLQALAAQGGAAEPMARAAAAYDELRGFGFLGALRWRSLLIALRDAFALVSSQRAVDWSVVAEVPELPAPILRSPEPSAHLN